MVEELTLSPVRVLVVLDVDALDFRVPVQTKCKLLGVDLFSECPACLNVAFMLEELKDLQPTCQ